MVAEEDKVDGFKRRSIDQMSHDVNPMQSLLNAAKTIIVKLKSVTCRLKHV